MRRGQRAGGAKAAGTVACHGARRGHAGEAGSRERTRGDGGGEARGDEDDVAMDRHHGFPWTPVLVAMTTAMVTVAATY